MQDNPPPAQPTLPRKRMLWTLAGLLSLAIGIIGIFLPVLPTTPLVILAAYCFGKGSPRLRAWIISHRRFGPMIEDWEATGAIPRRVKYWACFLMALAFAFAWWIALPTHILVAQGALMAIGAAYVLSRPSR